MRLFSLLSSRKPKGPSGSTLALVHGVLILQSHTNNITPFLCSPPYPFIEYIVIVQALSKNPALSYSTAEKEYVPAICMSHIVPYLILHYQKNVFPSQKLRVLYNTSFFSTCFFGKTRFLLCRNLEC